MLKPGQVVKIIAPHSKYFGEEAVIQYKAPKTYRVRLRRRRPLNTRFVGFGDNGILNAVRSPHITTFVKPGDLKPVKNKTAKTLLNTWQPETIRILEKYQGKTKRQIERDLGVKLEV